MKLQIPEQRGRVVLRAGERQPISSQWNTGRRDLCASSAVGVPQIIGYTVGMQEHSRH